MLMLYEFEDVNLGTEDGEQGKTNQITPAYLRPDGRYL